MKINFVPVFFIVLCCSSHSASGQYAWDLLKQPSFKAAYLKMLGSNTREKWITQLTGPSSVAVNTMIGGEEFVFINSCKPHACDTNNIAIAYNKTTKRAFAKLREESGVHLLLGSPTVEVKSELEKYYEKRFGLD